MALGNTEPFGKRVRPSRKSTSAVIALGKGCIIDTSLTPDGWKQSDGASPNGPFRFAVDKLAAQTDNTFSGSLPGTELCTEAGGALTPGIALKLDAAGDVVAAVLGTDAFEKICGIYLHEDGTTGLAGDAADGDPVWILQIF